jgi:hypothetical protein
MTNKDTPVHIIQKFIWYTVYPVNFDDGLWKTFFRRIN